ncbi:glycosyltransferase family 39 protein [Polaribacter haliotis]|uniref:Glycosyltransferase family 39 protein n=1 Tax=Polaribacter haliotis TaxID=1888915 RepID=A0A7L8AHM3_9FLAO|nr:glycosyltransferase family 39 protein [Polaribacter haliotis]QOD61501.1 glycosyltransferase family 39 protein [Polaribacter haliotis]
MKNKSKFIKIDVIIISISLLVMLIVLNLPFKAKPFGDITFHKESKNLALFIKGEIDYKEVTITKAPGPIFFYTPVYLLVPKNATDNLYWKFAVVFTFLIVILCMLLIFRIGSSFFSKEIGLLSIILFFLFPIHFYYSLGILAEVPAFFSMTILLFGWTLISNSKQTKKGWTLFIVGSMFLILNRPNTILFIPISAFVVFYTYFKNKEFYRKFGLKIILSLIAIGGLSFTVLQVSKSVTGSKSEKKQEELLYYVAHQGRFEFREEPLDFRFWESDIRPDSKDYQNWIKSTKELNAIVANTPRTYKEVYRDFLINDFLEHPFLFTRQFFVKCFYGQIYIINSIKPEKFNLLFFKGRIGYTIFLFLINIVNIIILLGVFIFLFREKNKIKYWLYFSIIVALLIFHGITYMEPRYLFPSRVAIYLISAAGLYKIGFIRKGITSLSKKVL